MENREAEVSTRERMEELFMLHLRAGSFPMAQGALCALAYALLVDAVCAQRAFDRYPSISVDYWVPVVGMMVGTAMLSSSTLREIEMNRKVFSRYRRVTQRLWLMATVIVLIVSVVAAFYHAHQVFLPPRLTRDNSWPGIALVIHVLLLLGVNFLTIVTSFSAP